jgi:hypothetical protein
MVIFDYIIFGKKGMTSKKYPLAWSIFMIIYVLLIIIYSLLGGTFGDSKYPYDFMNVEKYGIVKVVITNLLMFALFIAYGIFIQHIDNKIGSKK